MKLTIQHEISVPLPKETARTVIHLLLTPRSGPAQTVGDWQIQLPDGAEMVGFIDAFGNQAQVITQPDPPEAFLVSVRGAVETEDRNGVLGHPQGEPVPRLFLRRTELTPADPGLVSRFEGALSAADSIAMLHGLMAATPDAVAKAARERNEQPRPKASKEGQSQSQTQTMTPPTRSRPGAVDLTHAFIGAARALGMPARYVAGYLAIETTAAPAMHAWAEVYDPGLGWIAFDPLLQRCPTDRHVRVACGLDSKSASPLRSVPPTASPAAVKLKIETAS